MKRCVLMMLLVMIFSGCGSVAPKQSEVVYFYYLEKSFDYETHQPILAREERDLSDHRQDLPYLMALYLMGPVEESHLHPLPAGTRIQCQESDGAILLELSEAARQLDDTAFSKACACLAQTCFGLSRRQQVTIRNGDRHITMTPDTLLLEDTVTVIEETTP